MNVLDAEARVHVCLPDQRICKCHCGRSQEWPEPSRANVTPPFVHRGRWVAMQKIVCPCGVIFAKFFAAHIAENLYKEKV